MKVVFENLPEKFYEARKKHKVMQFLANLRKGHGGETTALNKWMEYFKELNVPFIVYEHVNHTGKYGTRLEMWKIRKAEDF